jgi:hypothetical protein
MGFTFENGSDLLVSHKAETDFVEVFLTKELVIIWTQDLVVLKRVCAERKGVSAPF